MTAIVVPPGERFGLWTAIGEGTRDKRGRRQLICLCACGTQKEVSLCNLRTGTSTNCGCAYRKKYPSARGEDIAGQKFGRLTVAAQAPKRKGYPYWICECSCGIIKSVSEYCLVSGTTRSCGCLKTEIAGNQSRTHGMRHTRIYAVYCGMLARCYNPNNSDFYNYGGRGVRVCDRWNPKTSGSFENFLADVGEPAPGMTLDKDLKGGIGCLLYSPDNCTWISKAEQAMHTRRSHMITHKGLTFCLTQWARITGVSPSLLSERIHRGWSFEEAVKGR